MRERISVLSRYGTPLLLLVMIGCGGGGGGDGGGGNPPPGVVISGMVRAPAGPVADGSEVRLERVDAAGAVVALLASSSTHGGSYAFDLGALRVGLASDLVVAASAGSERMRAFAVAETVDVDATAEAIVRLVLEAGAVTNFTPRELVDARGATDLLAALRLRTAVASVDQWVAALRAALAQDAALSGFLAAAAAPGQTAQGVGDVGELFPYVLGNRWSFASDDTYGDLRFVNEALVSGTQAIGQVTTTVLSQSHPVASSRAVDAYLSEDGDGITNFGNTDARDALTPLLTPYRAVEFPLVPGAMQTLLQRTRLAWPGDYDGDERNETADLELTLTPEAVEDVEVPAGVFAGALRVRAESIANVRLSFSREVVPVVTRTTQWLAPGIGAVKAVTARESIGASLGTQTDVLIGYDVDGVRRGFQPTLPLMSEVSARGELDISDAFVPAVGSDGHDYLVVSCRQLQPSRETGLYGVLVSAAGEVSAPFKIARHDCALPFPGVPVATMASNGDGYLVVFVRQEADRGTWAARVTSRGEVIGDELGVLLNAEPMDVAIASDGTNYLASWPRVGGGLYGVDGALIAPDGAVLSELDLFTSDVSVYRTAVASDGADYLVTWRSATDGPGWAVHGGRVASTGTRLDGEAGFPIATGERIRSFLAPLTSFDGANYLVTWQDSIESGAFDSDTALLGRRITATGALLDGPASSDGIVINASLGPKAAYDIAFSGVHHLAAWVNSGSRTRGGIPVGLFTARLATTGALIDPPAASFGLAVVDQPLNARSPGFQYPALQSGDGGALLVWVRPGVPAFLEGKLIHAY